MKGNKGQVTIFIILVIIILAGVALFFVFRSTIILSTIPASIEPAYNSFLSCLQDDTLAGISVLEGQGGYINLPDFEPGSYYMPFSSQLDFLGNPVPYWYYVSGNNLQKEKIPTVNNMEEELAGFISERINDCKFDSYYEQGFEIYSGTPETSVSINDNDVKVSVSMNMDISKGEDNVVIKSHDVSVNSKLGTLYNSARKIYDYEQDNLFLEEYGVDTLRLYAPVDGVELTCAPLTWTANDVFSKIENAVEANTNAIKVKSGDFSLNSEENKYFVKDIPVNENVRFLNSKEWPHAIEVNPTEGNVLISKPVGNQEGLGILGFCYVPYHYVYNLKYPVLVQVFDNNEIFQFPLAVVIEGNNPRHSLNASAVDFSVPELCSQKNTEISVNIYDTKLNLISDARISYECFGVKCDIGETNVGVLKESFPQCANGDVIVESEGYKNARYEYSTINKGSVDIIMDKLYDVDVNLKLDGKDYNENATISFVSEEGTETIVYPSQRKVSLSQGQYEVQVYVYKNSPLIFGAVKNQQCVDVPQSGIGGFFGFTKQKCFTIEFPSQKVGNALAGGGKQNYYISESQIRDNGVLEINAQSLKTPTTIEQLQNNYLLFDEKGLDINFK